LALAVPLSRFTSLVGGGSAFYVRRMRPRHLLCMLVLLSGCSSDKVYLSRLSSEDTVRTKLLAHTPLGSSGTNVLAFALENFPHKRIDAYTRYVDSLEAAEGHRLPVEKRDLWQDWWGDPPTKAIGVYLGSYPVGLFFSKEIEFRWVFDERDALTNILVHIHEYGP